VSWGCTRADALGMWRRGGIGKDLGTEQPQPLPHHTRITSPRYFHYQNMTRATRVALGSTILFISYLLALFAFIPVPFFSMAHTEQILPVLPWWLLVSFGSYTLWSLGHGLYTFRECTDAYTELLNEVAQAKSELRLRGVSVD